MQMKKFFCNISNGFCNVPVLKYNTHTINKYLKYEIYRSRLNFIKTIICKTTENWDVLFFSINANIDHACDQLFWNDGFYLSFK